MKLPHTDEEITQIVLTELWAVGSDTGEAVKKSIKLSRQSEREKIIKYIEKQIVLHYAEHGKVNCALCDRLNELKIEIERAR